MGIKGLTDRGCQFPQIGNIRKGDRGGKNNAPRDLNYFRVEFDERETRRASKFLDVYQSQPTEINILLPFNEIERVWDAWCEAYVKGRMIARSDGEYFLYLVNPATGAIEVADGVNAKGEKVPHREKIDNAGKIKCKPVGRLKVIIPELQSLAYLVVHTTSIIDIRNISEQLEAIRAINGSIAGIPLVLRRRPKQISVPKDDGTKVRMTKYMLSIEADPEWVSAKMDAMRYAALPQVSGERLALPGVSEAADVEDDTEEQAEYEQAPANEAQVFEAEYQEAAQDQAQPEAAAEPQTPLRYQPEQLKKRLHEYAATVQPDAQDVTNEKRGAMISALEWTLAPTGNPDTNRGTVIFWLTGYRSMASIPNNLMAAIAQWMSVKKVGNTWQPSEMAQREIMAVLNEAMPKQDQLF